MRVKRDELDRIIGEYRRGTLIWELPGDEVDYPPERRKLMQQVESISEVIDAASSYGLRLHRVDGKTIDLAIWE